MEVKVQIINQIITMSNIKKGIKKDLEMAERDIIKFQDSFFLKWGIKLSIRLIYGNLKKVQRERTPKIDLLSLENLVNELLEKMYPKKFPKGIKTKVRVKEMTNFRNCFFKAARNMGYRLIDLELYSGFDHATIINGLKSIDNLIATNDEFSIININTIYDKLKERYGIEAIVQLNK